MTKKIKNFWLIIVSALTFVLSLAVFVFFLTTNTGAVEEAKASSYNTDQIIIAVNKERKKENLPELKINQKLMNASQKKADHMSEYSYFSHIHKESGKKWSDFIKESGYSYSVAGENLANGFYDINGMVQAWMKSPSHKENILNSEVRETGVGVSYGTLDGNPTIFVVQEFGKQL